MLGAHPQGAEQCHRCALDSKTTRPAPTPTAIWKWLQTLADQCSGALETRSAPSRILRESRQRFRDLFENSPDAIFVEDMDGTVLGRQFRRLRACTA